MTKRDLSEVNSFVLGMGNRPSDKIPVIYMEETHDLSIEKDGIITNKKQRYDDGSDIVFKCKKCKDLIGSGKKTNEKEDKVKIYCYNCKDYHYYDSAIIWSKNSLWHKPENKESRSQFENLMKQFVDKRNPEIVEI